MIGERRSPKLPKGPPKHDPQDIMTLKLTHELKQAGYARASAEGISLSELLRRVLTSYLNEKKD